MHGYFPSKDGQRITLNQAARKSTFGFQNLDHLKLNDEIILIQKFCLVLAQ